MNLAGRILWASIILGASVVTLAWGAVLVLFAYKVAEHLLWWM